MNILYRKALLTQLLVCFLFIISIPVSAQKPTLDYQLRLTIEDGNLENAKISIVKNGTPFRTIDSKKKYDLELDIGIEYLITASKNGYITKSIVVDTRVPEGREQEDFASFQSEIILKPQPEEEEITYTQPVGRIKYSNATGDFDYDKDYSAKSQEMQKKAEADPRKRPKPPKDSIKSKPVVIDKKMEYKAETNLTKVVPAVITPSIPSVTRTVVERTVQQDKLKITYRTVTINGVDYVYRKEEYSWGGVYFYKNAKNITENTFENDTK